MVNTPFLGEFGLLVQFAVARGRFLAGVDDSDVHERLVEVRSHLLGQKASLTALQHVRRPSKMRTSVIKKKPLGRRDLSNF